MKYKTSHKEIFIYLIIILGSFCVLHEYKESKSNYIQDTIINERVLVTIILNRNIEKNNNLILDEENGTVDIVFLEHLREMKDCLNMLLYEFSDEEKSYYDVLIDERDNKND